MNNKNINEWCVFLITFNLNEIRCNLITKEFYDNFYMYKKDILIITYE